MQHGNNKSGTCILLVVAAGLYGLSLAGCEQSMGVDNVAAKTRDYMQAITTEIDIGEQRSPATGKYPADSSMPNRDVALLIKVKSALVGAPSLTALSIDVGVLRGVITLYGEVDTLEHRDQAERIARSVPGVQAVESEIEVIRGS
jgi:osmotically-inducible protein OsmY